MDIINGLSAASMDMQDKKSLRAELIADLIGRAIRMAGLLGALAILLYWNASHPDWTEVETWIQMVLLTIGVEGFGFSRKVSRTTKRIRRRSGDHTRDDDTTTTSGY